MTEEKREVEEVVPPGAPLPDDGNPDLPVAPVPEGSPVKCGYVIGVREDGSFIFDVLGTSPGIVELLGLHAIVDERLQARMDRQLGGKFSLVITKLNELATLMGG
jgi:hypothetical protein